MLIRFDFKNHKSFRDETQLSMVASSLKDKEDSLFENNSLNGKKLSTAAIIYGANASGKSGVVQALDLMRDHILYSHNQGVPGKNMPRDPFILNNSSGNEPTEFGMDFSLGDIRYRYEFSYIENYVIKESLYSYLKDRETKLFERDKQDFWFGRSLLGQNKTISSLTRSNSLFLSAAAQNEHKQLMPIFSFFSNISLSPNMKDIGLSNYKEVDKRAIKFLSQIGTGIVDYKSEKIEFSKENLVFQEKIKQLIKEATGFNAQESDNDESEKVVLKFGHSAEGGEIKYFDLSDESTGTRSLLKILNPIFAALDRGSVIVLDEIDSGLHTQAVEAIIGFFLDPQLNKNNAQLICTVHDTNILNGDKLRRDQVWLVDKKHDGSSDLFSLSDVKTRKGDNIEKAYTQGRYGGTPLGSVSLWLSSLKEDF